jgi:DNA-binding MarR family transcriptional regulator
MILKKGADMSREEMPEVVAKRLGYALKRAQHALRISMDEALRPLGLTVPQYAVLCAIEAETGLSNARLARAAFVTPQTMQGVLANLEKNSLLVRVADPTHGRILRSGLTPQGRSVLQKAHRVVQTIEKRMVVSFGRADAARLAVVLSKFADDFKKHRLQT